MGRRHLGRQAVGVGLAMGHSRRQAGLEDLRTQRVCVVLQAQRVCEVSHFGLRRQARAPRRQGPEVGPVTGHSRRQAGRWDVLSGSARFHILSRADKRVRLGVRGWRRV